MEYIDITCGNVYDFIYKQICGGRQDVYIGAYHFHCKIYDIYWFNGKRHREGAPAYISRTYGYVDSIFYFRNGLPHNENGPAKTYYSPNCSINFEIYCLFGHSIPKEDFEKKMLTKLYW